MFSPLCLYSPRMKLFLDNKNELKSVNKVRSDVDPAVSSSRVLTKRTRGSLRAQTVPEGMHQGSLTLRRSSFVTAKC